MKEKNILNWHTFSEHLQLMFKDLYPKGQAHNFVLSASSPVLQNIIVKSTPPDLSERNSES